jgi:7-cyano-7-deazaguanine synthase
VEGTNVSTPKAVVLLSGGLDSTTVLAIAAAQKFQCHALSFDYGQRHKTELGAAKHIAATFGAKHAIIKVDLRQFGGSALTADIAVPKDRNEPDMSSSIPITYVPARNTVFLSVAVGWAEILNAHDIFIGVNALDYSGYPDCRPEFLRAFQEAARLGTKTGVEGRPINIHAPLISLHKAEIIQWGLKLGVDYSISTSCYDPDSSGRACGHCDSCQLRRRGFREAGVPDPTSYVGA